MPTKTKQYQLLLGTFIDNEFIWHDVDSFDTLEEAYKEYKKYVNDQLKYTDDELIKVWNTGRLDVELRRGNRLLNWTGIYVREVAEDKDEDENEKPKDKEKQDEKSDVKDAAIERVFEDERGWRVSESELRRDYEALRRELPEETDYTFGEYLAVCTGKNGTLTEVKTGAVNTKDD